MCSVLQSIVWPQYVCMWFFNKYYETKQNKLFPPLQLQGGLAPSPAEFLAQWTSLPLYQSSLLLVEKLAGLEGMALLDVVGLSLFLGVVLTPLSLVVDEIPLEAVTSLSLERKETSSQAEGVSLPLET